MSPANGICHDRKFKKARASKPELHGAAQPACRRETGFFPHIHRKESLCACNIQHLFA
jgi:hypothetical protein